VTTARIHPCHHSESFLRRGIGTILIRNPRMGLPSTPPPVTHSIQITNAVNKIGAGALGLCPDSLGIIGIDGRELSRIFRFLSGHRQAADVSLRSGVAVTWWMPRRVIGCPQRPGDFRLFIRNGRRIVFQADNGLDNSRVVRYAKQCQLSWKRSRAPLSSSLWRKT
jgi:hypothetical protein